MRNKKTPALVNLAIYTTITIFLWIFFDIYRALRKPVVVDVDQKILEPVYPILDKNILEELKNSIYFDASFLIKPEENVNPIENTEPAKIEEVPISSESGEINE